MSERRSRRHAPHPDHDPLVQIPVLVTRVVANAGAFVAVQGVRLTVRSARGLARRITARRKGMMS